MEQTNIDMEDMEEMEHEEMEIQQPAFGQEKSNKDQEKKAPEQAVSPMKKVNVLLEEQSNMLHQLLNHAAAQREEIQSLRNQIESIHQKIKIEQHCEEVEEKRIGVRGIFRTTSKEKKKKAELLKLLQQVDFGEDQLEQIQKGIDDGLSIEEIKVYAVQQKSAVQMEKIRKMYVKIKGEENE